MKGKGIRTTITAFAGLLALLAIVAAYVLGKIETEQLTVALSAVGTSLAIVIGFFAKDQNKSHTIQGTVNPDPPGPPPKDPPK